MRVLMLNYEYPPIGGGAAPMTRALSEQLAISGHHVDVVTMGYGKLPFKEQMIGERLRVFRVPALRMCEAASANGDAVYDYLFTWESPALGGFLGSCHALEIPFVFGRLDDAATGPLPAGGGPSPSGSAR